MFSQSYSFSREQVDSFRNFSQQNNQNIQLIISRLLLAAGFKLHLRGANYLTEAIEYCYRLPTDAKISFSGQVYPYIAQKFDTVARNVDRDIRFVLHNSYNGNRIFVINELCGYELISHQYPPTTTEFVINVATWLKTLV